MLSTLKLRFVYSVSAIASSARSSSQGLSDGRTSEMRLSTFGVIGSVAKNSGSELRSRPRGVSAGPSHGSRVVTRQWSSSSRLCGLM